MLGVGACDCAVDLEVAEHALDPVALAIERLLERMVAVRLDFGGMTGLIPLSFKSARIASVS